MQAQPELGSSFVSRLVTQPGGSFPASIFSHLKVAPRTTPVFSKPVSVRFVRETDRPHFGEAQRGSERFTDMVRFGAAGEGSGPPSRFSGTAARS